MFPQFGATAETLSKASTMVFRIGTDAHLYDDPEDGNILQLLDSKFDSEKCEALKRLLALIAQGFDVSNLFPQVPLGSKFFRYCAHGRDYYLLSILEIFVLIYIFNWFHSVGCYCRLLRTSLLSTSK